MIYLRNHWNCPKNEKNNAEENPPHCFYLFFQLRIEVIDDAVVQAKSRLVAEFAC